MDPRSSAFFNPTASFPPPPRNPDVNWAQLAQRWVAEHAPEQPPMMPSSSGNYHGSRPSFPPQQNPQYGNFFMPPPSNNASYRPPPFSLLPPGSNFMPHLPPPLMHPPDFPPMGPPVYNSPIPMNQIPQQPPQRPLFQSHAHEVTKTTRHSPTEEPDLPFGAMAHWMNDFNDPEAANWISAGDWSNYDANAVIDQQMRKRLPVWILEGLEKAELEKAKKADQEQKEKIEKRKEAEKEKRRKEKGLGKFDTDSEDEEDEPSASKRNLKPVLSPKSLIGRKRKSREIDEQEYNENRMSAIKRLVTDVLLEASDKAINNQMQQFLSKFKKEAKPKLVSKSAALASLSSIVEYSDDDESDEAD